MVYPTLSLCAVWVAQTWRAGPYGYIQRGCWDPVSCVVPTYNTPLATCDVSHTSRIEQRGLDPKHEGSSVHRGQQWVVVSRAHARIPVARHQNTQSTC